MPTILVNPLDETPRVRAIPPPRLPALTGKTIGLLDISKPGDSFFLDRIERLLTERYAVARVIRETKPTFTRPAPAAAVERVAAAGCDAVIEALAD